MEEVKKEKTGDDSVAIQVKKLFKLGEARNVPRGVPSRVSTAYGTLASPREQWFTAEAAEQKAMESQASKEAKRVAR